MRALSAEAQRTALLGRQLLLERAPLDPVRAVEKVGGLQTQYSPSGYVGLWSRLAAFSRDDLTEALHRGRIVQGWMMRCTIHMVSAADWAPLTEAVRQARRALWLRTVPAARELDMPAVAATVADLLADGPRKQAEITARLVADGFPKLAWQGVQLWLDLVRIPPAGTWDSPRAHVYELASRWLRTRSVTAPQELLVRRYLGGFGPATPQDVARYAGWSITDTRAVLARMSLREFADGLVDLPRAPLPPPGHPGTGPLPRPLGRRAPARARHAHRDPARRAPGQGLPRADAAVHPHLPGRRPGGGDLDPCRRGRAGHPVRAAVPGGAGRGGRRGRAAGGVLRCRAWLM